MLKGVGAVTLRKVAALPGLLELSIEEIVAGVPQVARSYTGSQAWEAALASAERQIDEAHRHDARIVSICDSEYPKLLSLTKDDPAILYMRGQLSNMPEKSAAVIGTREPTEHGVVIARRVTQFFADNGWSVVSGLALGCDAIAHQAAIDAGGHTVAVLAHGLQTIAPARHRKLADAILAAGGALVSEYPFGQHVLPQQFVKRDRTQAGLARGVVMIQSDLRGGSLHASRAALSYDRWLAVPYPTARDRENCEPKIQANLLVADGEDHLRADLLHCSLKSLSRIIILRTKGDYLKTIEWGDDILQAELVDGDVELAQGGPGVSKSPPVPDSLFDYQGVDRRSGEPGESHIVERSASAAAHHRVESEKTFSRSAQRDETQIVQLPRFGSREYYQIDRVVNNRKVVEALGSRLRYIQDRYDFAMSAPQWASVVSVADSLAAFAAEEVVGQMADVVQFLIWLSIPRDSNELHFGKMNEQQFPAVEARESRDLSPEQLLAALRSYRKEFSHWFLPENEQRPELDGVLLRELAKSFNVLVEKMLLSAKSSDGGEPGADAMPSVPR